MASGVPNSSTSHATDGVRHSAGEAVALMPHKWGSGKEHADVRPAEFTCIGCKTGANICPNVFQIEEDFGRSRVYSQSGSTEQIQDAIDSCPVNCIHWTSAAQLSLLENEMRGVERVNKKVRTRMVNQENSDTGRSWSDVWGSPPRDQNNEEEASERAKRAAAAARRW